MKGEEKKRKDIGRTLNKRRAPEESVYDSEAMFRDLAEKSLAGIYLIQDEVMKYVNPRLSEIFGYTVEELTGVGPEKTVFTQDWPKVDENIRKRISGEVEALHYEFRGVRKSGEIINLEVYGSHTTYQGKPAVIGTMLDITKRTRAEELIRQAEEKYRSIFENASVAIFTLDKDGTFTSVNPALGSLFGLGPQAEEKLIGFNWLMDLYTMKCPLAEYIQSGLRGEPFQLWDFPYTTYSGERNIYMDFKGIPLKGKDGAVEGLLCIVQETTERVKAQTKLMEQAKMLSVGRLAAGIAHELNNPLAALVAHSELAGCCLKDLEDSVQILEHPAFNELKSCLSTIEKHAFRCKSVTSDIIGLPWKEGFEDKDIDVNRLLSNILESGNISAGIVKEMSLSLPAVRGDITALRQVFVNLINNAVDAVEGRPEATIYVRTKFKNDEVLVEIEDNGAGIPDAIAGKIFEPFFTTKGLKKGAGLGLPLCEEFLSQMGGTIRAESKTGCGTIFIVRLPVQSAGKSGVHLGQGTGPYRR